jgi:magnesium transporter
MARFSKNVSSKAGMPPGVLRHIGRKRLDEPVVSVFDYSDERINENVSSTYVDQAQPEGSKRWIDVRGLQDVELVEQIARKHGLHPLQIEDILTTGQRPKIDDQDDNVFIVMTAFWFAGEGQIDHEQVSVVLGKDFVLSFQEGGRDPFSMVKDRLRSGKGMIRKAGADYLAYALIDSIVDNYFVVLEDIEAEIEHVEDSAVSHPDNDISRKINSLRNEILRLRKGIWPLREVITRLLRDMPSLVGEETHRYLRDLTDHILQAMDIIETFREIISDIRDAYLSSISNKLNEVMKVLTIFASIFIPLTFIVGIYGMNFINMPEVKWPWGYFGIWCVMLTVAGVMIAYFRKKKWM